MINQMKDSSEVDGNFVQVLYNIHRMEGSYSQYDSSVR